MECFVLHWCTQPLLFVCVFEIFSNGFTFCFCGRIRGFFLCRNIFMVIRPKFRFDHLKCLDAKHFHTNFIQLRNNTTTIFVLSGVSIQHQCAELGYGWHFDSSCLLMCIGIYMAKQTVKQVSYQKPKTKKKPTRIQSNQNRFCWSQCVDCDCICLKS